MYLCQRGTELPQKDADSNTELHQKDKPLKYQNTSKSEGKSLCMSVRGNNLPQKDAVYNTELHQKDAHHIIRQKSTLLTIKISRCQYVHMNISLCVCRGNNIASKGC